MTEIAAVVLGEVADVDTVQPGDEIRVGKSGYYLVGATPSYDDGTIVVVYFADEEASYENKARDKSGFNRRKLLVEKSLIPMRPGTPVEVIRGSAGVAETRRAQLEREQTERWTTKIERMARAAAREQAAAE